MIVSIQVQRETAFVDWNEKMIMMVLRWSVGKKVMTLVVVSLVQKRPWIRRWSGGERWAARTRMRQTLEKEDGDI